MTKRLRIMEPQDRRQRTGFALIVTLIMLVLAAVIAITLLTNASLDRLTASAFTKRVRAEMAAQSGLAAALNALVGASGPTDFRYITAVGDDGQPVLIPLKFDPATAVTTLDSGNKRLLYSTGTAPAILTLSTTATPKETRTTAYVPITTKVNGADQEVQRYAFYIDEGGSRQNLGVQAGASRTFARDPNEIPLVSAVAAPAPFNSTQITALKNDRGLIFTPMTANPILNAAGAPATPPVDDYSFAAASAIANLAPDGNPRLNLTKLKDYVEDRLPSLDQAKGNERAHLVDRLLDPSEKGLEWGPGDNVPGGNLSFLVKAGHYSTAQCHQIVANLVDYLDSDVIPTTDDVDNPTYFGVDGKASTDGTVTGHPYINFVATGMVFNRSNAAGFQGGLNSTRLLVVLGLVNPWSAATKEWNAFYIKPEIEIEVQGTATGGQLGPKASDYFHGVFNEVDTGNEMVSFPPSTATGNADGKIPPNRGFAFPNFMSTDKNYATNYNILAEKGRQPAGMVFDGLGFKITKLRLKYTSTDGKKGYIQVLDNLKNTVQPANPSTVDLDHSGNPSSLVYKFTRTPEKTDFHINNDPRLNYLSASWLLSKSTEDTVNPPAPATVMNIFTKADKNNWDFTGGAPTPDTHKWYTSKDITADFYIKSPPPKDPATGTYPAPALDSAGEIGFLHAGIPWETLRLYVTGSEVGGKERDKETLAYVHSGTFTNVDYGTVPAHVGQGAPPIPIPLIGGPLNINTNKRPTLQALFMGASALIDSDATARANNGGDADAVSIANGLAANSKTTPFALNSDLLSLPAVQTVTNSSGKDFERETLARRVANMVGNHSTRFTVYAVGEARDKTGTNILTTSTVNLRAEVEMQTSASGKPIPKVLSSSYYLSN